MMYLQMSMENAPWIWFVLTGIGTLATAMGIPKIWQIIKDDKCEKKLNTLKLEMAAKAAEDKSKFNSLKIIMSGIVPAMEVYVTAVAKEFPERDGLNDSTVIMKNKLEASQKLIDEIG